MATSSNSGNKASGLAGKLGFKKGTFGGFLAVVLSGQLFYSCLQALRGPFYTQLLQMLHVNNTQFGLIFTITSISSFLTLPGGWVMNRFSVKSILITCLSVRLVTILAMIYGNLSVTGLYILAAIWSLIQSVFFPTVLNGVALLSTKENKSIAFSMLEWIRRALQLGMDWILVGLLAFAGMETTLHINQIGMFKFVLLIYDLLLIPLIIVIWKAVPSNGIAADKKNKNKNKDALVGLGKVLAMPRLWLAALTAFTIYWASLNNNYAVPYLQNVFKMPQNAASLVGTITSEGIGIVAAMLSGFLADKWLHSISKMIMLSLILVAVTNLLMVFLPKNSGMTTLTVIMLMISSFGMFSAKAVYSVPASLVPMPEKYRGSAMAVNSFVCYLPNLFALTLAGQLLDKLKPVVAYNNLWLINGVVAVVGILLAAASLHFEKKDAQNKPAEPAAEQPAK